MFANNLVTFFLKLSFTTKCVGIITILMYFISFIHSSKEYLSITPGYLMPPKLYVWTLLTFVFFDDHFYCLIINIATLIFSNNLLEPLWGQRELLKYLSIVSVISGLICFFSCYFLYLFTYFLNILFYTHIHGMIAFSAAVTVAVRQTLPDDIIMTLPMGNIRNFHLSFIGMICTFVMACIRIVTPVYPFLFVVGILVSWIYLRFYQKHSNGNYGDLSDNFEFAGFFPNHLKPPVSIVANAIFSILVRIRICKKMERLVTVQPISVLSSAIKDPIESERRKALALKALNERLTKSGEPTPWPVQDTLTQVVSDNGSFVAPSDVEAATDSISGVANKQKTLTATELKNLPLPDFKAVTTVVGATLSPTHTSESTAANTETDNYKTDAVQS